MELDLLGHAQVVVQQVATSDPPLRAHDSISNSSSSSWEARNSIWPASRWPSSVANRNDVARAVHDPHRPVPGAGHAHHELVAHPQ